MCHKNTCFLYVRQKQSDFYAFCRFPDGGKQQKFIKIKQI